MVVMGLRYGQSNVIHDQGHFIDGIWNAHRCGI